MAIRSLDNLANANDFDGKVVVADTSYLIALSDETDRYSEAVKSFHFSTIESGAIFVINVTVRQEFISAIRKKILIDAILRLAERDSVVKIRYLAATGLKNKPLTSAHLKHDFSKIYSNHVKAGDVTLLIDEILSQDRDIYQEVVAFEEQSGFTYVSGDATSGDVMWEQLGQLLRLTAMSATDAMIANLAFSYGAAAIATTDCDFACLSDAIDIYLPVSVASGCQSYAP